MKPEIAILVPHFQTPKLTLLCLRLIRRHTTPRNYETIVIDNGSADGSGEMLKRLRWLRVVRREPEPGERATLSHGRALNLGMQLSEAPNVVTLHTDTMVLRSDWLTYMLDELECAGGGCGGVGSWKMERSSMVRSATKWAEDLVRGCRGRKSRSHPYLRSHCALYRREAVRQRPAMFEPSDGRCAGEELHDAVIEAGFRCRFLSAAELGRYVNHLNHATLALNEQVGAGDKYVPRTRSRAIRRIDSFFRGIRAERILADESLDY